MTLKLSTHAFTRFWDVHAWAGVVGGLLLYLMFLTGSITLFHEELGTWEEPLAQRGAALSGTLESTLARGLAAIGSVEGEIWFTPSGPGHSAAKLAYDPAGAADWTDAWIDPGSGAVVTERERLSSFLYSLHFLWHDATGDWLYYFAGLLAVALLLALVTGVLIHVKDIARQFHQFRTQKSRRVLWSDLHKVLGVMGLPFQLMYAYTGAFIVLGSLLLPTFTGPVFGGDEKRATQVAGDEMGPAASEPGPKVRTLSADELLARARTVAPELSPEYIQLRHHGHYNGTFEFYGVIPGALGGQAKIRVRERDGVIEAKQLPGDQSAVGSLRRWIFALHFARYGGVPLRALYFVLGLATCGTILTGNWVWLARREAQRADVGNRVLARLTAGVGAGSWVALAALFLVSRVFPLDWPARGVAEELTFVGVLAACIAWAFAARHERTAWWPQLALAGALFLPVPLLAARWSDAGLFGSGDRIGSVVGVDITLLVVAALLGLVAAVVGGNTTRGERIEGEHAEREPALSKVIVFERRGARDA